MDISKNLFLIPLVLALMLLIQSLMKNALQDIKQYKIGEKRQGNVEIIKELIDRINIFVPKKGSKIHSRYLAFLGFTRFSVKEIFRVKFLLFIFSIMIAMLIIYTNIGMNTKKIFNKFDYTADLLYQYKGEVKDKELALKQEVDYVKIALGEMTRNQLLENSKEDIQARIKSFINVADDQLLIPKDIMANKVYHRVFDYYEFRNINFLSIFIIALIIAFLPEVLLFLFNFFARADSRRELRFLKKLIIVNGAIKPVDFMELLELLIDKAWYYKGMLKEIQDANKRNDIDNRAIYSKYISTASDLDTKLFYEKLDQANNYDFDQAILNIHNEFKMEKREQIRKIKKRIDLINIMGILFFMVLIVIMIMYLLIPWMQSYDMSQLI